MTPNEVIVKGIGDWTLMYIVIQISFTTFAL